MRIVIEQRNIGDDELIPVVFGRNDTLKPGEDEEEGYDLSFVRWENWLSMTIDEQTAASYTESEIVAYCLDEMTDVSFSPFEIEQKLDEIRGLVDEIRQEGAAQDGAERGPSDG